MGGEPRITVRVRVKVMVMSVEFGNGVKEPGKGEKD